MQCQQGGGGYDGDGKNGARSLSAGRCVRCRSRSVPAHAAGDFRPARRYRARLHFSPGEVTEVSMTFSEAMFDVLDAERISLLH
jgi:hypothetical protein